MLALARALKQAGLLGINRRNAQYTLAHNQRRLYPLVDDKLRTKQLAAAAGIATPQLYAVVSSEGQVREVHAGLEAHPDFVIKPAHGSGGEGIVVITGRSGSRYRTVGGSLMTPSELDHHIYNALSGLYSLGGQRDQVILEYRVRVDPVFAQISYQGVPDIRVIVFLGVPVMAMVRLPTRQSGGKANLHQGAIGAGVDMGRGQTLSAVWRNQIVREHPDTGQSVPGVAIPGWESLLALAARCSDLTGLGYQGVDLVLDQELGPLILELNARPGLAIQLANRAGLVPRLELVENRAAGLKSVEARVDFARENFAVGQEIPGPGV